MWFGLCMNGEPWLMYVNCEGMGACSEWQAPLLLCTTAQFMIFRLHTTEQDLALRKTYHLQDWSSTNTTASLNHINWCSLEGTGTRPSEGGVKQWINFTHCTNSNQFHISISGCWLADGRCRCQRVNERVNYHQSVQGSSPAPGEVTLPGRLANVDKGQTSTSCMQACRL